MILDIEREIKRQTLLTFWSKLQDVTSYTFQANSYVQIGWNATGFGEITLTKNVNHILVFHEKGTWQNKEGVEFDFRNILRWTLDSEACKISIEHLRYGEHHPVFLFYLTLSDEYIIFSSPALW
jgi:hypothetical protein